MELRVSLKEIGTNVVPSLEFTICGSYRHETRFGKSPPIIPMRLCRILEKALAALVTHWSLSMKSGLSEGAYNNSTGIFDSRNAPTVRALLGSANLPWMGQIKQGVRLVSTAVSIACALSPRNGMMRRRSGLLPDNS